MKHQVRRSWLLVSMSSEEGIIQAHLSDADVIVLDLVELAAEQDKPAARQQVASAIGTVRTGGAEVFAQVDSELLYADLQACAWPDLTGIIIAGLTSPQQVEEAHCLLGRLEEERGILSGTVEIVASLETAQGNFQAYDIATASPRVSGLTLGRADLVMDLRPESSGEIHLMQYLMQRLITVANAAEVVPLGAWWREPDRGLLASPENTYHAAVRGRSIGFKGCFCLRGNQVGPLNRGFTPNDEEVNASRRLLEAYYEEIARRGADSLILGEIPGQGDRIIDRGASAQAQRLLELADACKARDQAKAEALEQQTEPGT